MLLHLVAPLLLFTTGCQPPAVRSVTYGVDRLPVEEPYATADGYDGALARDIVRWTNVERLSRRLPPVYWSETLARAARAHAAEMVRLGYFDHESPVASNRTLMRRVRKAGLGGESLFVGENIAKGTWRGERARQIVQAWMESDGHRENLLRRSFRYLGVGVAWDGRSLVAAQVFGNKG
jgi:uncharacterized protein YkwD